MMTRSTTLLLAGLALALTALPVDAGNGPPHTCCYVDGRLYRTVGTPAATPNAGLDNLYRIEGGVDGQVGVSASAPGDTDYDGGFWAVYTATWVDGSDPSLLTSEEQVLAAADAGDLILTRQPAEDFRCPLQP
jgi:hypothetical protein